jgi:ribosome-binding factor A
MRLAPPPSCPQRSLLFPPAIKGLYSAVPRSRERNRSEPSQRQLRVGELVRHAMADMLARGEVHDPVLEGHLITVPEVRMSGDLRLATIYVMPLGGRDRQEVLDALERNKRYLRGEIGHRVNLKFAPDIRFMIDERFDEAQRIDNLLRTPAVQRDLGRDSDDET